jgi:F-type H+-transporting ATPase subunit gamma
MSAIINSLASKASPETAPTMLVGTGAEQRILLVVLSADRGLCGGFNGSIIRATRREVERLRGEGKTVDLLMVGRKAKDALKRELGDLIVDSREGIQGTAVSFADIDSIADVIRARLENGELDRCLILYNRFISAITQEVTLSSLIPVEVVETEAADEDSASSAPYEYEPDEATVLEDLLPRNLSTQIYTAILESSASELAARMTAMDNATRNAGDLIDRLTMEYNRRRQAAITTELIEIISGAEAL